MDPPLSHTSKVLRLLIIDDHAIVRAGTVRLLGLEPDIEVVGECADADAAEAWLQSHRSGVDVILMDLSMPGRSGLDLLRSLRSQGMTLPMVVCSMHDTPAMVAQAFEAGASGFLTKASDPLGLAPALRRAQAGERVLSADLAPMAHQLHRPAPHEALEPREFEVLLLLAQGVSLDAIAQRLQVSPKRVANVQTIIRRTLGVQSGIELLRYAREHGLVMD